MTAHFEILETLALKDGQWQNWPLHWARLQITAQHFRYPLMQMQLESDMQRLAQTHASGNWHIRMALQVSGVVQITAQPLLPSPEPVTLQLAPRAIANSVAQSDAVRFKTSVRGHYDAFKPSNPAVFDVVLFNEDGQITEGTRGNIAACIDGRWVTPPLECGLLPGVGRALALAQGRVSEQVILVKDMSRATQWAFINSMRGWLDARWLA